MGILKEHFGAVYELYLALGGGGEHYWLVVRRPYDHDPFFPMIETAEKIVLQLRGSQYLNVHTVSHGNPSLISTC